MQGHSAIYYKAVSDPKLHNVRPIGVMSPTEENIFEAIPGGKSGLLIKTMLVDLGMWKSGIIERLCGKLSEWHELLDVV